MDKKSISRRAFIKTTAVASSVLAAGTVLPKNSNAKTKKSSTMKK